MLKGEGERLDECIILSLSGTKKGAGIIIWDMEKEG